MTECVLVMIGEVVAGALIAFGIIFAMFILCGFLYAMWNKWFDRSEWRKKR